ncbi:gamma-glutamylcyclotransferase [Echria macrotheca]|uniref:gamma-glutamylcyclotransferase n=1 Tax=Echria macrotheca TaxID=438768 RepID=A0AAJ0BJV8_9PEZI|nr:gamma-glutamylcyclotransferase [Echria macrotheca]
MASTKTYFGYGSNLWQDQMARRCPSSPFTGVGRLRGYKWMINSRGYANVAGTESDADVVWGLIYELPPADEARLDINEGVPYAYEKRMIEVEFWDKGTLPVDNTTMPPPPPKRVVEMLVYIDFVRRDGDGNKPQPEYVHRMNEGIRDALREGVPRDYIDSVLRKYIPVEDEADDAARDLSLRQAVSFVDESGVFVRTGSGADIGPAVRKTGV